MASLAGEYWATDGGAGTKVGTSFGNAAAIDPGDANDIWAIINAGTVASDVVINLCADAAVTTTATIGVTKDATSVYRITVQGRDVADRTDTEVTLDADGGAFPVFTLTTADYWQFKNIHATNTDEAAGHEGWAMATGADFVRFWQCRASHCRSGWNAQSGSYGHAYYQCRGHDNAYAAFYSGDSGLSYYSECVMHDNAVYGVLAIGFVSRCVAYGNGDGINVTDASHCVSYNNTGAGFEGPAGYHWGVYTDCIAVGNGTYGWDMSATNRAMYLNRCADYGNTSGRIDVTSNNIVDENDPGLSSDPFADAANADFSLNNNANGGALCRNTTGLTLPGLASPLSYHDIGAYQHRASGASALATINHGGEIKHDSVDVTRYILLIDAETGGAATGVTIADLDLQYTRNQTAPSAKVDATALGATDTAHTDNYAIEIDATDQPGVYRVDWPDAAFATGVDKVTLTAKGPSVNPATEVIDLVANVAADIISDTEDIQSRLPAALVAGRMSSDAVAISGSTGAADDLEGNIGNLDTLLSDMESQLTAVEADTQDIQGRIPAALVSGRIAADAIAISGDTTAADNLELQYDTTGLVGDTFPATQAQLADMQGSTFNTLTDSLEAIRNRGDAAWLTSGYSI